MIFIPPFNPEWRSRRQQPVLQPGCHWQHPPAFPASHPPGADERSPGQRLGVPKRQQHHAVSAASLVSVGGGGGRVTPGASALPPPLPQQHPPKRICDLPFYSSRHPIFHFFPLLVTTWSASKRSRRTRRYATIIRTSLRRAWTSTATAQKCAKTRAARGGPAFTSTACLLCDTSCSSVGRFPSPPTRSPRLSVRLPACVASGANCFILRKPNTRLFRDCFVLLVQIFCIYLHFSFPSLIWLTILLLFCTKTL